MSEKIRNKNYEAEENRLEGKLTEKAAEAVSGGFTTKSMDPDAPRKGVRSDIVDRNRLR